LISLAVRTIPDPEISAQFFPLFFSIIQILVMYVLILELTGSRFAAIAAAILIALAPFLIIFSTRAKQYSLDSLITACALLAITKFLQDRTIRNLFVLVILFCFFLLLSYVSVLIFMAFLTLYTLEEIIRSGFRNEDTKKTLIIWAGFILFLATYFFLILRQQTNPDLVSNWEWRYIPWDQGTRKVLLVFFRILRFILIAPFVHSKIDQPWIFTTYIFVFSGIFMLLKNQRYRLIGWSCVFVYLGMLLLLVLKIYPSGGGRTDIFSYPITLTLFVCGLAFLKDFKIVFFSNPAATFIKTLLATGFFLWTILPPPGIPAVSYPDESGSSVFVASVERQMTKDDGLLIYPGRVAFCYYTSWDVRVIPKRAPGYDKSFDLDLMKSNILILPPYRQARTNPSLVKEDLDGFFKQKRHRIFHFATHYQSSPLLIQYIDNYFSKNGYQEVESKQMGDSMLRLFIKIR
jgi:hypothetical protein